MMSARTKNIDPEGNNSLFTERFGYKEEQGQFCPLTAQEGVGYIPILADLGVYLLTRKKLKIPQKRNYSTDFLARFSIKISQQICCIA